MVAVGYRVTTSSGGFIQQTNLTCTDRAPEITQGTLLGATMVLEMGLVLVRLDKPLISVTCEKQIHVNMTGKVGTNDFPVDGLQFHL